MGNNMFNAWKLFAEWVNYDKGGLQVGNRTIMIEFIFIEDFSNTTYTTKATNYLINKPVDYMFAPFSNTLTKTTQDIAKQYNILLMSASASITSIFQSSNNIFGTLNPAYEYIEFAFQLFDTLGGKTIGIIDDTELKMCNISLNHFESQYGIKFVLYKDVSKRSSTYDNDLRDILNEFHNKSIETILGCTSTTMCLHVIKYLIIIYSYYFSFHLLSVYMYSVASPSS
jgi:hypothetical protein